MYLHRIASDGTLARTFSGGLAAFNPAFCAHFVIGSLNFVWDAVENWPPYVARVLHGAAEVR
jgi:hypothetical protein